MIFFIIIFLLGLALTFFLIRNTKASNTIGILVVFLIICTALFRPKVNFPDYPFYLEQVVQFDDSRLLTSFDWDIFRYEIGFWYLIKFLKLLFVDEVLVLWFPTIINTVILLYSSFIIFKNTFKSENIKLNKKPVYNILIFITLYYSYYGFYYNFVVLRAGLALSLMTLGFALYFDKKFKTSIFFILLSLLFHQSALIGILVYLLLLTKPFKIRLHYFLFFFSIFLYLLRVPIFISNFGFNSFFSLSELKNESLIGSYLYNNVTVYDISYQLFFIFFQWFFVIRFYINSTVYGKLLNLYSIGIFIYVLGSSVLAFSRASDWFNFIGCITLFMSVSSVKNTFWKQFIIIIFSIINLIFCLNITGQGI